MISENSTFKIKYVANGFVQVKRILTYSEMDELVKNKLIWVGLNAKEKVTFEKKNKVWSDFGEVHPESPIGVSLMGKGVGDIGSVELPSHQGGIFELEILEIDAEKEIKEILS